MIYHIGFLFQVAQYFHGAELASAMRTDIVTEANLSVFLYEHDMKVDIN